LKVIPFALIRMLDAFDVAGLIARCGCVPANDIRTLGATARCQPGATTISALEPGAPADSRENLIA